MFFNGRVPSYLRVAYYYDSLGSLLSGLFFGLTISFFAMMGIRGVIAPFVGIGLKEVLGMGGAFIVAFLLIFTSFVLMALFAFSLTPPCVGTRVGTSLTLWATARVTPARETYRPAEEQLSWGYDGA